MEAVARGRGRSAPGRATTRPRRSSSGRRSRPARRRSARTAGRADVRRDSEASSSLVLLADVHHVAQPVVDQPVTRSLERCPDTAAAVVAAHDHVLHGEDVDRVLQHRQAVEVGVDDDVRDVAVDEHARPARDRRSRSPARGCPSSRSTGTRAPGARRARRRSGGRAPPSRRPTPCFARAAPTARPPARG